VRRHKIILVISILIPLVIYSDTPVEGPLALLAKADRLAMLYNWPEAKPLYLQAESLFKQSGDLKNALAARLGYIWSTADSGVSASIRREVAGHLLDSVVNSDLKLRMRALIAKAVLDRNNRERQCGNGRGEFSGRLFRHRCIPFS
jgi:hypothetical protein